MHIKIYNDTMDGFVWIYGCIQQHSLRIAGNLTAKDLDPVTQSHIYRQLIEIPERDKDMLLFSFIMFPPGSNDHHTGNMKCMYLRCRVCIA